MDDALDSIIWHMSDPLEDSLFGDGIVVGCWRRGHKVADDIDLFMKVCDEAQVTS